MISPPEVLGVSGDMAMLSCLGQGGPMNSFEWTFMGNVVSTSQVLTVSVDQDTFGVYTCEISNDAGSDTASATVHCE